MDQKMSAKYLYENRYNLSEEQQNEILSKADSTFKAQPNIDKMISHLDVLKNVAVGKKFTDFEMADPKGEVHQLSEFVGNGKVVLIDFWASWCPPCRKEMPHLVELYKQYKNKGFEIVGISLDSKPEAWAKGVKDLNITWTQLSDLKGWQNAGAALYGVNSIPHTVLVDKDGTIIAKNIHGEEIDAKLQEALKNKRERYVCPNHSRLEKDSTFETQMDGHTVTIDTSKEDGGTGSGVRPKALMLVAMAGCSGVDVISLFKKMRVRFEKLSIDVKAETSDTIPMLYTAFDVTYHVTGNTDDSVRIEKAIRLSQEKYCGVALMMKKIGPITYRILLNGSELNIQPTDK